MRRRSGQTISVSLDMSKACLFDAQTGTSDQLKVWRRFAPTLACERSLSLSFAHYPSLRDRVVFITGGGSGIGAAMVEAFWRQGAKVAFVDIAEAESAALVDRLADGARKPLFIPCDLLKIPALEAAIDEVGRQLGPIQALINNAANDTRQKLDTVSEADWDRTMGVNLKHQFFAARAGCTSRMRGLGRRQRSVIFSSIAWMHGGSTDMTGYATAKATP